MGTASHHMRMKGDYKAGRARLRRAWEWAMSPSRLDSPYQTSTVRFCASAIEQIPTAGADGHDHRPLLISRERSCARLRRTACPGSGAQPPGVARHRIGVGRAAGVLPADPARGCFGLARNAGGVLACNAFNRFCASASFGFSSRMALRSAAALSS